MSRAGRAGLTAVAALAVAALAAPAATRDAHAAPGGAAVVSAPAAQARPATKKPNRAAKPSKAKRRAPAKPSLYEKASKANPGSGRPDLGHVGDRSPARAKVATGDRLRGEGAGGARRADSTQLTLEERTARQIEELLRGPLRDGTTSLFVVDAATGRPLFAVYPDDPLNPASNVKLIATAAALDILGPDYRYVTRVLGETPADDGTIETDLYLLGSYDPTLSRAGLADLAGQLAGAGVRRIGGDVLVGETSTRDGIYRASVRLEITGGPVGQAPQVTVSPATDFVEVEVRATTVATRKAAGVRVDSGYVTGEDGRTRLKLTVAGTVGKDRRVTRDVAVAERALYSAHVLRGALRDAGVEVAGDVRVTEVRDYIDAALGAGFIPVPLAEVRSAPLEQIAARINKRSTNWLADRVIMTAAARKYGGKPSMEKAVDAMYAWLARDAGLRREDLVIDTGSGLSYRTELSARQVVEVLRAGLGLRPRPVAIEGVAAAPAAEAAVHEAFRASLAIGGVDGTIRGRFRTLDGHLRAKTGTLARVVSLSGVIEVDPSRQLVFSIITNGHQPKWKTRVRQGHEQLVKLLCGYLQALPAPTGRTLDAAVADGVAPAAELHVADDPDELADDVAGVTERAD